jgi:hypothetical protein
MRQRQGLRLACPEQIASKAHKKSGYGHYLQSIYDSEMIKKGALAFFERGDGIGFAVGF